MLAGQAKKPLALEQFTEGWGSSEGKVRSGQAGYFAENFLLTQQVSPGTVDFHRVVTFLLVDVEDETIRTEVLPQLPLDVALQVLVALLLIRQVVAHVVIGWTVVLLHCLCLCLSLFHEFIPESLTQKDLGK